MQRMITETNNTPTDIRREGAREQNDAYDKLDKNGRFRRTSQRRRVRKIPGCGEAHAPPRLYHSDAQIDLVKAMWEHKITPEQAIERAHELMHEHVQEGALTHDAIVQSMQADTQHHGREMLANLQKDFTDPKTGKLDFDKIYEAAGQVTSAQFKQAQRDLTAKGWDGISPEERRELSLKMLTMNDSVPIAMTRRSSFITSSRR
ncbi:MAG: hypothetical protein WDN72_08910 [Alphaproteobacteria bacterium]